jgi:hypothetical protein
MEGGIFDLSPVAAVPEPRVVLLMLLPLMCLGFKRLRRRNTNPS